MCSLPRHWMCGLMVLAFWSSTLVARIVADEPAGVAVIQDADGLELRRNGRTVLRYHTSVVAPPQGIDAVFRRSGFLHPVATPSGRVVTADFPADHAHQHGVFSAWVKTSFEGRGVDFWNQAGRTGNVEHVRVLDTNQSPDRAEFRVELRHLDLTSPTGPSAVLSEVWTIRLHAGHPEHVFDLESRQTCVAESPLTIQEYHYGGMAFRGCDHWFSADKSRPTDFEFVTSDGLGREAGNHSRPNWVAAVGTIDGAPCGLGVLAHPGNFRHPAPVRLHPTKPYFAFSPCVLGEFQLQPNVEWTWRYRYVAFDGPLDASRLNALWSEYADESKSFAQQ